MLKDIITIVSETIGGYPKDATSKASMVRKINRAALRLYTQCTLVNSLDEVILNASTADNVVTLPSYIGKVRSIRHATTRDKIDIQDFPERYHESGRNSTDELVFKTMRPKATLRSIEIAGKVTVYTSLPLSTSVVVTLMGSNDNSGSITETVELSSTAQSIETDKVFSTITSITKSSSSEYDIYIKDINDNILAVLPNDALKSEYTALMIFEPNIILAANQDYYAVEVLYKKAFRNMVYDEDSFLCGDIYDEAISWEYAWGHYAAAKDTKGATDANVMVNRLITNIARDNEQGLKKSYDAAPNRYLRIHSLIANNNMIHGYRSDGQ